MFDWQFPEAEESDVFYLEDVTFGGRSGVEWRELGPHGVGALHQHPEVSQRKTMLLQRVHEVVLGEGPGHRVPVLVELQDRDDVLPGLSVNNTKNILTIRQKIFGDQKISVVVTWISRTFAFASHDSLIWLLMQVCMSWEILSCGTLNNKTCADTDSVWSTTPLSSVGGKHEQGSEAFTDHLFHLRHSAPVAPICPSKKQKCKCAMFIQKHYTFSFLCHFN